MSDPTLSDIFVAATHAPASRRVAALHVVLRANQPFERASRHLLDGIDMVQLGRGDVRASRDRYGGMRRLTVSVPDPVMSSDHGRLLFAHGQWIFEDPRSKNGAVVDGQPTRAAVIAPGTLFMLGHTMFLLDEIDDPGVADSPLAGEPPPPVPSLTTLAPRFAAAADVLGRVAPSDLPVVLLGETGTGKEVFARALHAMSGRRGAFVAVNCGGLAPALIESEMFGHRRGSFTGAIADRPGYLRSADGGTLFLDEIGELPLTAQASLLRALQLREVVPVGDATPVAVDLRVCVATHRNLADMVAAGTFREDLYARLLGVTIALPPLRERRCDLGLLIAALLRTLPGGERARLSPDAAFALCQHRWPLNVRELERCLAAALVLAGRDPIERRHLPITVTQPEPAAPAEATATLEPAEAAPMDRDRLDGLMRTHRGNVSRVAAALRTSRSQVKRLVARFGLVTDTYRR